MPSERLQKILSRAGFGSRRKSEELIEAGRVLVNGQRATLGSKADPEVDRITVDGRPVELVDEKIYVAIYKPRNVLSAVTAPDPRPTVRDLVPLEGHLYPVGRLDVDSEGLMLLTNDGELANRLTHPRYGHEKEYRVLVARRPDEEQLDAWRRGVVMEDEYKTQPAEVRVEETSGKGAWLRIVMREGRKRQIREIGALLGLPVVRIVRVRIGTLLLGSLRPREWRRLSPREVGELKGEPVKTESRKPAGPPRPPRPFAAKPAGRSTRRSGGAGAARTSGQKPGSSRPGGSRPGSSRPGKPAGPKPPRKRGPG